MQLRLLAETADDTDDLRVGRVDLQVGSGVRQSAEFRSQTWGTDRLVVVGRRDHPALSGELTPVTYAALRHLTVSRRGRLHDPVDHALADLGLARMVAAAAPTMSAALPGRTCQAVIGRLGLQVPRCRWSWRPSW